MEAHDLRLATPLCFPGPWSRSLQLLVCEMGAPRTCLSQGSIPHTPAWPSNLLNTLTDQDINHMPISCPGKRLDRFWPSSLQALPSLDTAQPEGAADGPASCACVLEAEPDPGSHLLAFEVWQPQGPGDGVGVHLS